MEGKRGSVKGKEMHEQAEKGRKGEEEARIEGRRGG